MKISAILPAYNEESVIEEALGRIEATLKESGFDYEIIVVDDGSTDNTRKKALKYAGDNDRIKVVSHGKNLGKGSAVKSGVMHSTGDVIVFIDSDLEIDPSKLLMYVKALKNADVAIGSKWHPKSRVKVPLMRKILSKGFYILAKLFVGIKVNDTQVGLKAFRRKALIEITRSQFAKRYAFDVELLAIASLLKLKVVELPVNMQLRSGFKLWEILNMLKELLEIVYRLRVKKLYQHFIYKLYT